MQKTDRGDRLCIFTHILHSIDSIMETIKKLPHPIYHLKNDELIMNMTDMTDIAYRIIIYSWRVLSILGGYNLSMR